MDRRNGRLDLERPGAVMPQGLFHQGEPLGDELAIPQAAVLVLEQNDVVVCIQACVGTRMLDELERVETHDLRLTRKEPQQQSGQPDSLLTQRNAHVRITATRRITFVEKEINHGRHSTEPRSALGRSGCVEWNVCRRDPCLGSSDPLLHCALAHEKRARNLLDGEP